MDIRVDAKEVLGWLNATSKQAPFAIMVAMNRTAEEANYEGRKLARKNFTIREEKVLNYAFPIPIPRSERATKQRLSILLEPTRHGVLLEPYETGRPHTYDRLGRNVAMPSFGRGGIRTTKATVIPRQIYPVNLGLQPRRDPSGSTYYALGRGSIKKKLTPYSVVGGKRVKQGRFGTYEVPSKTRPGVSLVFQRVQGPAQPGRKGAGARLLWIMKPSVKRPKILHFYDTINETIAGRWEANLLGAWDLAQRTAR